MLHDLSPAYVQAKYHSPYGIHLATWPTRAWSSAYGTNPQGGWLNWGGTPIDADDAINELVTSLADHQPSTVTWDSYIIYTKADATSPSFPVTSGVLGIAGTSSLTGWYAAVQWSFNMLDTAFNTSKLVILEAASGGDFGKVTPATFTAEQLDTIDKWTAETNAWSSRAGFRPSRCDNITKDLNDRLRREYHIT